MLSLAKRPGAADPQRGATRHTPAPPAHALGNQARLRRLPAGPITAPAGLQAKLEVGAVDDPLEREADQAADRVMRMVDGEISLREAPPRVSRACAACSEEEPSTVRTKRAEGLSPAGAEAPGAVHEVLSTSGRPLGTADRAFFEPRFGRDFSAVRVHDDDAAARSARSIGARAWTVGSRIAFAQGAFVPGEATGRRLLAHELAHVAQQGAAPETVRRDISGQPAPAEPLPAQAATPPPQAEAQGAEAATCLVHFVQGRAEFTDAREFAACSASIKAFLAGDASRTVELSGFASEEGDAQFNADLAQRRADTVKALLVQDGAPAARVTATGRGVSTTYPQPEANRRVEIVKPAPPPPPQRVAEVTIASVACPPSKVITAASLDEYVSLMECAEARMGLSPREMLTVFRQLYYGKPWSVSKADEWNDVVQCPANVGDPQPKMGPELFGSLLASQEVAGVDVGHVFVGLEAMMCPTPSVSLTQGPMQWTGSLFGATTVNTANEDFSTWAGDLGAAVAARAACAQLGPAAAGNDDCFHAPGPQSLNFYLRASAPDQDLQGDIDPFVLRAQALGIPCGGSAQKTATMPAGKMSEVFDQYYNQPASALGKAHAGSIRCFLDVIGAQLDSSGKTIVNRDAWDGPMIASVGSFALTFYYKIRRTTPNIGEAGTMRIVYARDAVNWFLDWLQARL